MDISAIFLGILSLILLPLWLTQQKRSRNLERKYSSIISIEKVVSDLNKVASNLQNDIETTRATYKEKRELLEKLEHEIAVYDERLSFVELGMYEPHFEFDDSESYKSKVREIREKQKRMISQKTATICPTNWTVDGSLSKGKTMANRQTRLTMRAFNNECEAAIANTRWNNVVAMEKRILNSAKQIDNANASMNLEISRKYISLKLDELRLTHELREQQKREKDERAELARAEREEKRLLAEVKAAEREEQKYQQLLERAKKEISGTEASAEMLSRIKELEKELANARSTSERARSMAEMTKSGYVYIISNIGSFGEDVVKIGLTRRIDPEDRVRELGDASVPFKFDTHAMIYSEDAPNLESSLHKEFSDRRINMSNMRKEFFNVKLEEIEKAVNQLAPEANFFRDREAQEWHETLARREQILTSKEKVIDKFPFEI